MRDRAHRDRPGPDRRRDTASATLLVVYLLADGCVGPLAGRCSRSLIPLGVRALRARSSSAQQRRLFADQLPDVLQGSASAIRAGHGLDGRARDGRRGRARAEPHGVSRASSPTSGSACRSTRRCGSCSGAWTAATCSRSRSSRRSSARPAATRPRCSTASPSRCASAPSCAAWCSALTAQGRLSRWVVTALPVVLLLIIAVLQPRLRRAAVQRRRWGSVMLAVGGALMIVPARSSSRRSSTSRSEEKLVIVITARRSRARRHRRRARRPRAGVRPHRGRPSACARSRCTASAARAATRSDGVGRRPRTGSPSASAGR